ncbi:MAG TPA: hypothetical protein VNL77_06370 [Roseiflexaceae bacterium]|nr:hypothetical protein [Roseiflexaceae bacterium]
MPRWSDLGGIWTTLRDIDVGAIREEAERPLALACVGHDAALAAISRLLGTSLDRYPAAGASPLMLVPLAEAAARADALRGVDLLLLAVDARRGLTSSEGAAFARAESLAIPYAVVLVYGGHVAPGAANLPPAVAARAIAIANPATLDAADQLAAAVLRRLPSELHLAAARRLPGLRAVYARELIGSAAFSNASYALASGLPEQIPILSVPFAAADLLVLTKNQAMLVYRLALAYGAPPGFQERIREVLPVVGGAFLWRQLARSLVGLIPVWGLAPKVAVAYAGTYTTGVAAWRWYERGELVSSEQLRRISAEALTIGRARAAELVGRAKVAGARVEGLWSAVRDRLPFRRRAPKDRQLT